MAATKMDVDPCQTYIQDALKDGRCTLQTMSLKAIKRDVRLQAREESVCREHAHALSEIMVSMGDNAELAPIVVFLVNAVYYVVDGFHRIFAYEKLRRAAIRAYVVKGTWSEAVQFAAMANQRNTAKPRSKEDVRKAILMLLSCEDTRSWADARLARHIGCSASHIVRARAEAAKLLGIPIPDVVMKADGDTQRRRIDRFRPSIKHRRDRPNGFMVNFGGKTHRFGRKEDAEAAAESAADRRRAVSSACQNMSRLSGFLARHGIASSCVGQLPFRIAAREVGRYVVCPFDVHGGDIYRVLGNLVCGWWIRDKRPSMAVILDVEAAPKPIMDLFRREMGIEFLSPDELVERIKAEESSSGPETAAV